MIAERWVEGGRTCLMLMKRPGSAKILGQTSSSLSSSTRALSRRWWTSTNVPALATFSSCRPR